MNIASGSAWVNRAFEKSKPLRRRQQILPRPVTVTSRALSVDEKWSDADFAKLIARTAAPRPLTAVRERKPKELVLAVPVAPLDTIKKLHPEVDAIVCLDTPEELGAVAIFTRSATRR